MNRLIEAIEPEKMDWWDLLVMAGFWNLDDHKSWFPKESSSKKRWWRR